MNEKTIALELSGQHINRKECAAIPPALGETSLVSGSNRSGNTGLLRGPKGTKMQAWWESFVNADNYTVWQLRNTIHHFVILSRDTNGNWSFAIGDVNGSFPSKVKAEEAKAIVAHKFAVMLIEQATAVLTIGA